MGEDTQLFKKPIHASLIMPSLYCHRLMENYGMYVDYYNLHSARLEIHLQIHHFHSVPVLALVHLKIGGLTSTSYVMII